MYLRKSRKRHSVHLRKVRSTSRRCSRVSELPAVGAKRDEASLSRYPVVDIRVLSDGIVAPARADPKRRRRQCGHRQRCPVDTGILGLLASTGDRHPPVVPRPIADEHVLIVVRVAADKVRRLGAERDEAAVARNNAAIAGVVDLLAGTLTETPGQVRVARTMSRTNT